MEEVARFTTKVSHIIYYLHKTCYTEKRQALCRLAGILSPAFASTSGSSTQVRVLYRFYTILGMLFKQLMVWYWYYVG
jgi:hypothetical protein